MIERVQFSKRASKDMERFDRRTRERVSKALKGLVTVPPRSNLDVRPLMGHAPWLRLRVGEKRVILRLIDAVYLVGRVIDRRDLYRALDSLK